MPDLQNDENSVFSLKNRCIFAAVAVAQLVRASDCGSEGRGFESH